MRVLSTLLLLSFATACQALPQATASPTPIPVSLPAAPSLQSGRQEASLVAGPRRRLEETFAAMQRGDIAAARAAMEAYDAEWNGIEAYVNFRSRELYGEIESHYQADVEAALEAVNPDRAQLVRLLQEMVGQYDAAIRLSDTGPPISPIFDEVAMIRIVRSPLRGVSPALKANDLARAHTGFAAFKARWPEVEPLFQARAPQTVAEISTALAEVDRALSAPTASPSQVAPLVDALLERYNAGLNAITAQARAG